MLFLHCHLPVGLLSWYINELCIFRGQMISQEDYEVITRLDNSAQDARAQFLKERPYLVSTPLHDN